jgi:hypothetical protein
MKMTSVLVVARVMWRPSTGNTLLCSRENNPVRASGDFDSAALQIEVTSKT